MPIGEYIGALLSALGDLWGVALIGSFFVMICEAAKPKRREDEEADKPSDFALPVMILSLVTPLLLFFHAFLTVGATLPGLIALVTLLGGLIIGSGLIGWIISLVARDIGRTLNRAAPILAVIVFALTLYVTWASVFGFVNDFVTGVAAG
ncbi:MAG: hypothetical protein J0L81_08280 [Caulobacterales bacterium]|jgi:hypothetical protein|nr:hypothetical protein [Caulobacterales bacterium]